MSYVFIKACVVADFRSSRGGSVSFFCSAAFSDEEFVVGRVCCGRKSCLIVVDASAAGGKELRLLSALSTQSFA